MLALRPDSVKERGSFHLHVPMLLLILGAVVRVLESLQGKPALHHV